MNDEEKIKAIMVELVNNGIYDLESFAKDLAEQVSDDWDPSVEAGAELVGNWYVLRQAN